jgi:diguanylate cyclase (GGDEF)-like protein
VSDSETPQHNAGPERAVDPSAQGPVGPPVGDSMPPAPIPASPDTQAAGTAQAGAPTPPAPTSTAGPRRQRVSIGKLAWAAAALLCVVAGVIASLLGAHKIARNDAAGATKSSQQSAAAAASTARLAVQREEELRVSGATYLAGNPKATPAEFDRWAKWAQTLRRYPELQQLGLVTLVRAPELASFGVPPKTRAAAPAARTAPGTPASAGPTSAASTSALAPAHTPSTSRPVRHLAITPAGARPYYCLASARLARHAAENPPAGLDYCAARTGLLLSRDTGFSHYTAKTAAAGTGVLEVMTPVYRGNQPPATQLARQGAFVGWLRELFSPAVVVREAMAGHAGVALRLSFHSSSANAAFLGGKPQQNTPSTTINLHNGWTLQSFAAPVSSAVLSDGNAVALLIVGCVLSALVGLLVLVLGGGRTPAPAARVTQQREREVPADDLYDRLTGLPNRALMLDRAECMLARAGRQSGLLVGALFIDIDWFEDVNQRLGRPTGDQILKIVAERLESVVRAGDTVGRLGSDEFVLLVESAARGARLDSLARRVVESLHKPFDLEGTPSFFLTASIGVAFGRYAGPEDLLRDAQLALHAAKSAGKDRYTLFNANMRSVIEGRGVLEVELNAALADKQFFVLYEPIFDLSTGKVAGLEALVRWLHPKQGVLGPADFIPLAEETGLTVPIGRWVLEEACGRAAAWHVEGHQVGITVEVSANQVNRDGFITDVRRALQQSGIEPAMLTLAIPETTVMRDVTAAVERLQEIKQLGVRIAIDDFGGSGYAYHSDLRRLPLDFLKVDRGSLAASEDEDYRTWLLEAIMIVGRDLSLTVIAKGIESLEQMSALQSMGCTMAQGQLMGKPVPASAIDGVFSATLPIRVDTPSA